MVDIWVLMYNSNFPYVWNFPQQNVLEKKGKQTILHQQVWTIFPSSKRPLRLFHHAPIPWTKLLSLCHHLDTCPTLPAPLLTPPNPASGLSGTPTLSHPQPLLEISPHLLVLMETKLASETLPPTQEEAIFSFIFQVSQSQEVGGGVFFAPRHSFQIISHLPSLKNSRSIKVHTG